MKLADHPLVVLPILIIVIAGGIYIAVTRGCTPKHTTMPPMKDKPVTWLCEDGHIFEAPANGDVRTCVEPGCDAQAYQAAHFECVRGHKVWIWFKPGAKQFKFADGRHDWEPFESIPPCPYCGTSLAPAPPE